MNSSSIRVLDIKQETRCVQSNYTTQGDDWHAGPLFIYIQKTEILNLYESEDQGNQPSFRLPLVHTRHLDCAQPPNASKGNMCAHSIDTISPFRSTAKMQKTPSSFPQFCYTLQRGHRQRKEETEGGEKRREVLAQLAPLIDKQPKKPLR